MRVNFQTLTYFLSLLDDATVGWLTSVSYSRCRLTTPVLYRVILCTTVQYSTYRARSERQVPTSRKRTAAPALTTPPPRTCATRPAVELGRGETCAVDTLRVYGFRSSWYGVRLVDGCKIDGRHNNLHFASSTNYLLFNIIHTYNPTQIVYSSRTVTHCSETNTMAHE